MKKIALNSLLLGALLAGFASPVSAADCNPCCPPSCCEWSLCDGKFKIGADWLYWRTQQNDLGIAGITTTTTPPEGAVAPQLDSFQIVRPHAKWQNGYRVYASYELPCDQWELGVAYTCLPAKSSHAFVAVDEPNETLIPFTSIGGIHATSMQAKWNNDFAYVDVDISRTLKFGECFRLRPHIGFRAAWQNQNYHVESVLVTSTEATTQLSFAHLSNKFRAYGVEGGLWGEYNVSCGLSIIGHVGGSILYSKFEIDERLSSVAQAVVGEERTITHVSVETDTVHDAIPSLDYFVGLQYADNICDFDYSIHAGWEAHVFFDMNRFDTTWARGNFSTQGLTLGLDVGF